MTKEKSPVSQSRRRFLMGLGASLALPLVPGCGFLEQFEDQNCGSFDCTSLPVLEVDSEFRSRVERSAQFIRDLMHPNDKDFPILFQQSGDSHSGGLTQPGNTPLYSGPLVVRLFLPDSTVSSVQLAEKMVVHEAVHAYDISTGYNLSRYLRSELVERLSNADLTVVDESTYTDNPLQSNHGHPEESAAELLASTVNVIKTHPDRFIEMTRELPESSQLAISNVAFICINSLARFAYHPTRITDLPFDPNVLQYIESTQQLQG